MATSSEKIHEEVCAHLKTFAPYYKLQFPAQYMWLNCTVPSSLSGLAMTDPEQLQELQKIAEVDVAKKYKNLKNLFK
jgi:division protein CdvB (Snf7/Vps24/ESCRT-III family)